MYLGMNRIGRGGNRVVRNIQVGSVVRSIRGLYPAISLVLGLLSSVLAPPLDMDMADILGGRFKYNDDNYWL